MVKNLLILRFGNEFFGATWNRNHIDNVQVSSIINGAVGQVSNLHNRLRLKSLSERKAVEVTLTISASFAMLCKIVCFLKTRVTKDLRG